MSESDNNEGWLKEGWNSAKISLSFNDDNGSDKIEQHGQVHRRCMLEDKRYMYSSMFRDEQELLLHGPYIDFLQ